MNFPRRVAPARWLVGLIGLALGAGGTIGRAADMVVVSSTAAPDYQRELPGGGLRAETYVVTPGLRLGATVDQSRERVGFQGVLNLLAPALARREYWPAEEQAAADLLIVVHWGETEVYTDPLAEFRAETLNASVAAFSAVADARGLEAPDTGALNSVLTDQFMASQQVQYAARRNAELLGYARTIEREERRVFVTEDERTMKTELAEPRYFIVLMAYDYAALRDRKERRLRWVTRMSVRSPGNNFELALPTLVRVAGPAFGVQQDGLTRVRTKVDGRVGEVSIGEAKVVESSAEDDAGETPGSKR